MANRESLDAPDQARDREPSSEYDLGSVVLALAAARSATNGGIPVHISGI